MVGLAGCTTTSPPVVPTVIAPVPSFSVEPAASSTAAVTETVPPTPIPETPAPTVAAVVTAPPPPPVCAVAYWPADKSLIGSTVADDVRGENPGTIVGGASFTGGRFGEAIRFDGVDDFVRIPSAQLLNPTGSFTFEAWINPAGGTGPVIQKWGDEGDWLKDRAYSLLWDASGALTFAISDDGHQGDGSFHGFGSAAGVAPAATWTHVAVVFNQAGGTRRIYAGGVQVAVREDPPTTITASKADLGFGAHIRSSTGSMGQFWAGLLDDVRYFSVALTAEQVAASAAATSAGPCV
jgi:hypothetical protein